ncbi:hypothetical protein XENTR_v10021116 [Xenopus tropicalis]|uniref:CD40 ligand n=1 Tax=Xenopus tropicalis TaxID=8364 RepID=A0A803KAB2_XENTR|nr:CD40 ligand (TNF superfamily, member 5, hyper-IgM syndrome) [Xenopus tropicalis]KAE8584815.1 hypothetical protein XENTR_v10021116 [Xenopus tropicalis]|eukprot:XP_002932670.2 PREDICTED: CD40 ligand [Xenopus tropicalis]
MMINSYNQSPPAHMSQQASSSTMKTTMWIFTLFILAQIIGTSIFGVYFYKKLDKMEEEMSFSADYLFLRRIQKCMKGDNVDPTLLNCKEVLAKFRQLISEIIKTDTPGEKLEYLKDPNVSTDKPKDNDNLPKQESEQPVIAAHLVGEKSNNKEVLQWMEKGYSSMCKQITYTNGKLKVEKAGIYYVYSQVSFCMNSPQQSRAPFVQYIYLSRPQETDKLLLKGANTFITPTPNCALHSLQQGAVFALKENDLLFVNVTDSSLVNYSPGLTYFGMFKL